MLYVDLGLSDTDLKTLVHERCGVHAQIISVTLTRLEDRVAVASVVCPDVLQAMHLAHMFEGKQVHCSALIWLEDYRVAT